MLAVDRYNKYKDEDLDIVLIKIRKGEIKAGKYSDLVKIDKKKIFKDSRKEYFTKGDGRDT